MTFLNPLVLIGLLAAAIPLIIHLFNFRKPKRIDFSSLAFLKELQKSTMRRVRIKQWILLALRTLAILCLVLTFARPTLTGPLAGTFGQRAGSSMALVVDNSLSMTLRDTNGEYLQQAREVASDIADQMEQGDEVFLLTTGDTTAAAGESYRNQSLVQDATEDIEPLLGAEPLGRTLARAASQLEGALNLNKEIYLLSDLQRSTFLDSLQIEMPDDVRLYLIPIGDRTHANVAVLDVQVQSRIVEAGQPIRIESTLTNYGTEALENYVVSVFLEGERVAQNAVNLEPGATTTLPFTIVPQRRGWLAGLIQAEDDGFTPDNLRHFTLHVPERRSVLLVQGEGQRTDFIDLALSPELTEGRIAFDRTVIQEAALAATSLNTFDAVVLIGVRTLSSGEAAALTGYVQEGGGLYIFAGDQAASSDYAGFLNRLGGGRFNGYSGSINSGRPIASFERVDLEHPLFEGIFEQNQTDVRVESPDLYFTANYEPGDGDEQSLIQLSNGYPFLQEIRHGDGIVLLSAVASDLAWSDLPVRGLFIPLMYRSLFYLSAGETGGNDGLLVGQGQSLRVTGAPDRTALHLVAPDGEEFIPEQRALFGSVLMQIPRTVHQVGVYDVRADDQLVRRVAFNADSRESDLNVWSADDAAERLEQFTGRSVTLLDRQGNRAEIVQAITEERYGVELWNVFLWLALLFLVVEMLVAMQWRPEPVPA